MFNEIKINTMDVVQKVIEIVGTISYILKMYIYKYIILYYK